MNTPLLVETTRLEARTEQIVSTFHYNLSEETKQRILEDLTHSNIVKVNGKYFSLDGAEIEMSPITVTVKRNTNGSGS